MAEDNISDSKLEKYFSKEYFLMKFFNGSYISSHTYANKDSNITLNNDHAARDISSISGDIQELIQQGTHNDDASAKTNFVDIIVQSTQIIKRLEKTIEEKSVELLNSENTIKVIFTQLMTLQKDFVKSHGKKCDYMIDDLMTVSKLFEKHDKYITKSRMDVEMALWERESNHTNVVLENLNNYYITSLDELFYGNYGRLINVPFFVLSLSDEQSILHKHFFDYYNELYTLGEMKGQILKKMQEELEDKACEIQQSFEMLNSRTDDLEYALEQRNQVFPNEDDPNNFAVNLNDI